MNPKAAVPPPDASADAPSDPGTAARPVIPPDLRIAVSPAQAAVGFGIIASLIVFVLRRRRRR